MVPFSDDDNNYDKTPRDQVSDSTNETSQFFSGGLVAFCFTGCSMNIKGILMTLTFFSLYPK